MAKSHSVGAVRSLTLLNTLLLVGAFTLPAYGQVETVVVTAERKSEDIQTVPVSVTALTSKDLKAKQVSNFRDLQFHVPSVTYTKSNFGGAQFQIRGITTQFGLGAAVAQNIDDVYLEAPALVTGEYYDVDRVEVLRGPQSTSYGRAATGGAVNIITTKPDLDELSARASVDYGTFHTIKPDAALNVPIIDGQLGVRFAIHGTFHDGYEKNLYRQLTAADVEAPTPPRDIFAGTKAEPAEKRGNSLGVISGRFSTRWQPSDDTTVDLVADVSWENDRRVRGDKQECHFDPSGVAGCLPDRLGFEGFNTAATLGTSLGSAQGIAAALSAALGAPGLVSGAGLPGGPPGAGTVGGSAGPIGLLPSPLSIGAAQLIGNTIGLCSIAGNGGPGDPAGAAGAAFLGNKIVPSGASPGIAIVPQTPEAVGGPCTGAFGNGGGGGFVSKDILTTNTAFNPKYKTYGGTYLLNWSQTITDWLKMTVDAGYADGDAFTQQDFTDATHENITTQIKQAQDGFDIVFGGAGHSGGPGYPGLGGLTSAGVSSLLTTACGLLPPAQQAACIAAAGGVAPNLNQGAIATNARQYDAVYFDQYGQLPVSNVHYNRSRFGNYGGIIDTSQCPGVPKGSGPGPFGEGCGIFLKSPEVISYDEDWFYGKEWTGEARFQTSFKGPLNFSAGLFYMDFVSENQYWVAANSLDWEAAVLGAFLTPCSSGTCSTRPYVLAMPTFVAEYRRGLVENESALLEATYDITDELKVIAGARFNDDRDSFYRTTKCAGGGLFAVNAANPFPTAGPNPPFNPGASGPCDAKQLIQPDPGAPTASDPNGTSPSKDHDLDFAAGLTDLYPIGSTAVNLPVITRSPTFLTKKSANVTDLWTGRFSVNWSPKLDFTDQTFVYFTASQGELAGGINTPNNAAQTIVPVTYKPAVVDSLELGIKNTLLDSTLTANLTAWYYNYTNYQVVVIANRQALELNIPAHLDGLEGEFLWQPSEDVAFNLTISATQSAAGHVHLADERNPTNNVPNSILVRDITNGSVCVVRPTATGNVAAAPAGSTPGDSNNAVHVDNFYLPNGGNAAIDAAFGIPLVNYGLCGGQGSAAQAALEAKGFDYTPATDPRTGALNFANRDGTGIARDLHGNRLPQVPFGQVGVGAQYTFHWEDFNFVPRVDYYWQSSMEARVWNDPIVDRINAWDVMNMSLNLNETDSKWHFQVFAKNVFDKHNPTGVYLQDPAAGLYSNVFSEDPRVVGFSIGDSW